MRYAGKENLISTESTSVTEPVIVDPSYTPGGGGNGGNGGNGRNHSSRSHSSRSHSGSSGSQKKEDKFAAEKSWREREEALARIDYAIGEDNYEEHTQRMLKIEEEFYRKQLAHTDLEGNERVVIEAHLYETLKKQMK